jgi:YD repeat-containing protein
MRITYVNNLPSTVVDNSGAKFTFSYTPDRKVKQVVGPNNLTSKYKFNGENLISVTNSWQNTYNYTYDNNHNLTRINLPDGTYKTVSYIETKDWVKDFRDRDGCVEDYDFTLATDNPKDHYWSTATKTCKGKVIFKSRYEFWYQMRPDKEKYLSRVLTEKNGVVTDISYHQDFPRPIAIRKGNDLTTFQYLANGLIKQKTSNLPPVPNDEAQRYSLTFSYDGNNKVDEVSTEYFTKAGKSVRKRKTQFKYDMSGRLLSARSNDGQFVEIRYNAQGLIAGITDQQKKEIQIEYDPKTNKPTAIVRPSVGSIQLAYGSSGELKKVQNKGGSSVNTQIYAAFSNFMDIVGPVSTELSLNL